MLFKNPRVLLSEAASADLLNPEVSEEVKDVINDLEDVLTNNVEEVKDADKTTNGGIPVTTESASLMEAAAPYGKARYLISLEQVMAIRETEEAEAAAAAEAAPAEEGGEAPTEEPAAPTVEPANIIERIADNNDVEPEQVAVVISAEAAHYYAQTALLEQKAGRNPEDCLATAKLFEMTDTVVRLINAGVKVVRL